MKQIIIINGPNLNIIGKRQPDIYGSMSFDNFIPSLQQEFYHEAKISLFQSNHEGVLIDKLHEMGNVADGIVFNPGGYAHTSVALADAVASINTPVVEVHISNTFSREEYRHRSFTAGKAKGIIAGFGMESYRLAIIYLISISSK